MNEGRTTLESLRAGAAALADGVVRADSGVQQAMAVGDGRDAHACLTWFVTAKSAWETFSRACTTESNAEVSAMIGEIGDEVETAIHRPVIITDTSRRPELFKDALAEMSAALTARGEAELIYIETDNLLDSDDENRDEMLDQVSFEQAEKHYEETLAKHGFTHDEYRAARAYYDRLTSSQTLD